jgi:hypothetical protein
MSVTEFDQLDSLSELAPRIPSQVGSFEPLRVETGEATERSIPKIPTPIWRVERPHECDLRARRPIGVRLRHEGPFFFAENEELALYGVGETVGDAVDDLKSHLAHFYSHYRSLSWDQVTGEARRLKQLYADLFIEEQ